MDLVKVTVTFMVRQLDPISADEPPPSDELEPTAVHDSVYDAMAQGDIEQWLFDHNGWTYDEFEVSTEDGRSDSA